MEEQPAPETGQSPAADTATLTDPQDQLTALASERDQLAAQKGELTELLQRSRAEFDNFRRRVERERLELIDLGASKALEAILSVLDDFDRALQVECADKEYARGIELVAQRFREALKKQGVEPMETKGKAFDPNLHNAVEMTPAEDVDDQTILDEYQKGYLYKGRMLRPAMVKVAVRG
jgi:molecular chaperone GrpE